MVLTLKKYLQECETRLVGTLAKELLNQVNDRFFHPENEILPGDDPNDEFHHVATITDHPDYLIPTLLDPRYKFSVSPDKRDKAKQA